MPFVSVLVLVDAVADTDDVEGGLDQGLVIGAGGRGLLDVDVDVEEVEVEVEGLG